MTGILRIGPALRQMVRRPVLVRALNAAMAAAVSWWLVTLVGTWVDLADRYPYYAPLGAVIAATSSVVGSVRDSARCVVAIVAGASLAMAASLLSAPSLLSVAMVVAVGTLVGGSRWLGTQGSWVPVSAIFVLVIGRGDPAPYAAAYAGLTALGAAVGILVSWLVPPLPLTTSSTALGALRDTLADQAHELADALSGPSLLGEESWLRRRYAVAPVAAQSRRAVDEATQASRGNWRARRWVGTADRQYRLAVALQDVAALVELLTDLISTTERAGRAAVALGPGLRPAVARVLLRIEVVVRSTGEDAPGWRDRIEGPLPHGVDESAVERADGAIRELVHAVRKRRTELDDDFFAAGAVVTLARQVLWSLADAELAQRFPSEH